MTTALAFITALKDQGFEFSLPTVPTQTLSWSKAYNYFSLHHHDGMSVGPDLSIRWFNHNTKALISHDLNYLPLHLPQYSTLNAVNQVKRFVALYYLESVL